MRRWPMLASALLIATGGVAGGLGSSAWAATPPSVAPAGTAKPSSHVVAGHEAFKTGTKQVVRLDPTSAVPQFKAQARVAQPLLTTPTAKINVTYIGFTAPARAAFQAAVNIWQTQVHSTVPIDVVADWSDLTAQYGDPYILGAAGPTDFVANFSDAPLQNVFYPIALANAIAQTDLEPANDCNVDPSNYNPSGAEISASFNSTQSAWYYGTDGHPGAGQVDLESVVLHELGHGLGFVGTFDVPDPSGTGNGVWGLDGQGHDPTIFDHFASDSAGQPLDEETGRAVAYANDSPQLGQVLLGNSGGPQWNGDAGKAAAGGTRPLLYAPSPFEEGSSFSHLDENTYPPSSGNALLTPALQLGEVEHSVGPILLGMFQDMGWPQSGAPAAIGDFHLVTPMRLVTHKAMTASQPLDLAIRGVDGVPAVGVKAVVVDVTVEAPNTTGSWSTRPSVCTTGNAQPSSQNLQPRVARSTQTILPLDDNPLHLGKVQIRLGGSSTTTLLSGFVTVDLVGWYDDGGFYANGGDAYHHLATPKQAFAGSVTNAPVDVKILGVAGVPTTGVTAVVVTAGEGFGITPGFLFVGPGGTNTVAPAVSYSYAELTQALAIVPVGTGAGAGKIRLRLNTGRALAVLNVVGWYGPSRAGGLDFHSDGPVRLSGAPRGSDVTIGGLPASTPVLLNVHVSSPTAVSTLSAAPGGSSAFTAVQELRAKQSSSGRVLVTTNAAGQVRLRLSAGAAIFYTDFEGWFSA